MSKEEEERYQINVKHGIMALNFIVAQRSASGATAAAQKKIKPSQTNRKKGKKKTWKDNTIQKQYKRVQSTVQVQLYM